MKRKTKTVAMSRMGVDVASETVQAWLAEAGAERRNVLRIRLTVEELLGKILAHSGEGAEAELSFSKWIGAGLLRIRYGGARFDPTQSAAAEVEEFSFSILARTGFLPAWRRRGGGNELQFRIPLSGLRPEHVMLGCIALALVIGLREASFPRT